MWWFSQGQYLRFMSSNAYSKINFDVMCDLKHLNPVSLSNCQPIEDKINPSMNSDISPAELFFDMYTGNQAPTAYSNDIVKLMSSIMMNGLPLLDLDDFVYFSDMVNSIMGKKQKRQLMSLTSYRDKFGNFLDVREKELRFTPINCWTKNFIRHLRKTSTVLRELKVSLHPDMQSALQQGTDNVWAIIEILAPPDSDACPDAEGGREGDLSGRTAGSAGGPSLTVRMPPSAISDTRNFERSPLKGGWHREQSGQLLYFLSGFLSLQLEAQNFFSVSGLGGTPLPSLRFAGNSSLLLPSEPSRAVAAVLLGQPRDLFAALTSMPTCRHYQPNLAVPIYHRAFPTRMRKQVMFWRTFAYLLVSELVVFFSLPAALCGGGFGRELLGGQLDTLRTLPGVRPLHSCAAWLLVNLLWCSVSFFAVWALFAATLDHSPPFLPAFTLFLCGVASGPMAMMLGTLVQKPDALVVAVPIAAFVTMLPGSLYIDLAFDVQRSLQLELFLCLLPSSAAALLLRQLCSLESMQVSASFDYHAPISNTPLVAYALVLLLDCVLYHLLALYLMDRWTAVSDPPSLAARLLAAAPPRPSLAGYQSLDQTDTEGPTGLSMGSLEAAAHLDTASLTVRELSKSFGQTEVLTAVSADLRRGCVTCLLGSNGAGKTTLLRVLCGLDSQHSGRIFLQQQHPTRRQIGWCPQQDPLYDNLTVREHLELFLSLLHENKSVSSSLGAYGSLSEGVPEVEPLTAQAGGESQQLSFENIFSNNFGYEINCTLARLGMLEHAEKRARELSGGMKRRLSLLLAFLGEPAVLLLDEPSSGCDAVTRELIRKDILSRRGQCAVLLSTHHMDDVEVLGDRVWFLNDRFLAFDGPIGLLRVARSSGGGVATSAEDLELTISQAEVQQHFLQTFASLDPAAWASSVTGATATWRVPAAHTDRLSAFLAELESRGESGWTVFSPSVSDSLIAMYGEENQPLPAAEDPVSPPPPLRCSGPLRQLLALLRVRVLAMRATIVPLLLAQILVPFLVVLSISLCCSEVDYPRMQLTSHQVHGRGEVSVSGPVNVSSLLQDRSLQSKGDINSDALWGKLFKEYFSHSRPRWAAYTVNDTIPDWAESTVFINASGTTLDLNASYATLLAAQQQLCSEAATPSSVGRPPICSTELSLTPSGLLGITSRTALRSALTMLTNVSTDHAAPVFLKELTPAVYQAVFSKQPVSGRGVPRYRLFSHPIQKLNYHSQILLERGYLGASMTVLYLLITTISCVQFVTASRRDGVTTQHQLAGVHPAVYWLSHLLFDTLLVFAGLSAALVALLVGGAPCSDYFFSFPPLPGALAVGCSLIFSFAVVAANFSCCAVSDEPLACQLAALVSTVCGGVVLKIFLDRHQQQPFLTAAAFMYHISPCYAFASVMFELFRIYVTKVSGLLDSAGSAGSAKLGLIDVSKITHGMQVMTWQAVAYLLLAVVIDCYWVKLKVVLQRSRGHSPIAASPPPAVSPRLLPPGPAIMRTLSMQKEVTVFPELDPQQYPEAVAERRRCQSQSCFAPLCNNCDKVGSLPAATAAAAAGDALLLSMRDVTVRQPRGGLLALRNLSLGIRHGERVALMGMNGGGKSSLFRLLALAENIPETGSVLVEQQELVGLLWTIARKRLISYVPQENGLAEFLTVRQTIELFLGLKGVEGTLERALRENIVPRRYLDYPVRTLSGGNKKKLLVLLAKMGRPSLLLLDECTSGVDPVAAEAIVASLGRLDASQSLLFASHRLDECLAICGRVLMLHRGQAYFDGPMEAFDDIAQLFYQVDVQLGSGSLDTLLEELQHTFGDVGRGRAVERVLSYDPRLVRLTVERSKVPLSRMLGFLCHWTQRLGGGYFFRKMDMEETLAVVIGSSDGAGP